ncbi:MAG: helix-turn-helix domain-containing protein [Oscillospiraceae bacterium]|nr:helix-turn-helix domain-containing protein [Oscillospiraceae bacterium]
MIDYKIIGKRIKKARLEAGLTQSVLAEMLEISDNYLSQVENGREHPNLEMLSKISIHTNVTLPYLLADTVFESNEYLNKEFAEVLSLCSPKMKRLIYDIACRIAQEGD